MTSFPSIISDLRAAGLSQKEISRRSGISPTTISELSSGKTKRPGYDKGLRLVQLHKRETKSKR